MEDQISFGNWIRRRRKSLDLTQQELARRVGCSKITIVKIEADERRPSRQLAELLAHHLKIGDEERAAFIQVSRSERQVELLEEAAAQPLAPGRSPLPELPIPRTQFVGRQRELAEIERLLSDQGCRLLTLAGPGGTGKTRLALAAATQWNTRQPGTACFVPLAPVSAIQYLLPTIADAIGFPTSGKLDLKAQLLGYLRGKQLLLVLDNLEHLLSFEAGGTELISLIAEILELTPEVRLLTTSRERLNMPEEWVFDVQGLPVPSNPHSEHLDSSSAVALFVQTARRVSPGFALEAAKPSEVVKICQLVGGLPLAIELAASWTRALSCAEIAAEIENSLDILSSAARGVPPRHRSIRAALDHSWELLSDEEKAALAKLSVFKGGFTRQAAADIGEVGLPMLSALVDKSLLRHSLQDRFDMHELIQHYSAERLREMPGVETPTREQHSRYFLGMMQSRQALLMSPRHQEALAALTSDLDNIRQAWMWAVEQKQLDQLRKTSWPMGQYYLLRNHFQEGELTFRAAIDHLSLSTAAGEELIDQQTARAHLQASLAFFIFRQGRIPEARAILNESVNILEKYNDQAALSDALWIAGYAAWFSGEFQTALKYLRQAHSITQAMGIVVKACINAIFVGNLEHEVGNYFEAKQWLMKALEQSRAMGDPGSSAYAIGYLSRTYRALGETERLEDLLHEGLRMARQIGDRFMIGLLLEQLAQEVHSRGDRTEAGSIIDESISLFQEIEDFWSLSRALAVSGSFKLAEGDLLQAGRDYYQAFQTAYPACLYPHALRALSGIAGVLEREGCLEESLEIAAFAAQHPASAHETVQEALRTKSQIELLLPANRLEEVLSRTGQADFESLIRLIPHRYTHAD